VGSRTQVLVVSDSNCDQGIRNWRTAIVKMGRSSDESRSGSRSRGRDNSRGTRSQSDGHERRYRRSDEREGRSRSRRLVPDDRDQRRRRHASRAESDMLSELGSAIVSGIDRLVGKNKPTSTVSTSLSISVNIVAEFNPLENCIEEWVNSVDEYALIHGWDDKTTSHLALGKLRGPAEIWYRGLPTKLFTWVEWRDMLLNNFKQKRNLHGALTDMMACVPGRSERLYEYVYRKLALIHKLKLPINDEEKVNLIMGGINDDQVKISVGTAGITDPHELANHLKIHDMKNFVSTSSTNKDAIKTPQKNNAPLKNFDNRACFACHKTGHFQGDCPDIVGDKHPKHNRKHTTYD
jgi:hypothetical protein